VIVAEISSNGLRSMGLDWSLSHTNASGTNVLGTNHTNISSPSLLGEYQDLSTDVLGVSTDVFLNLEALLQTGDAKIRANPRITTMHGRKADIQLVQDQYFIIQTGNSQSQYQYNTLQSVSSGIKLEITPFVSADSEITVHVKPEVGDVVGEGQGGLPQINTRSASTSVRVHDGETFSIGGLSIESHETTRRKVPILGSIPLLGYLFRYDEERQKESEVVIFVTPRILQG